MRLYVKITLFLLIVGLIPLVFMCIINITNVEDTVRHTADNAVVSLATELGKAVGRTVNDGYENILLLAQNPVITSATASRDEQSEELNKTQKIQRIFKDLTIINREGRVRASVFNAFRGSWKTTSWFKSALQGDSVLSDVHAVLYPMEIVMTAATPIKDKAGNINGVLVGQLDMDRVWQITRGASVGKKGEVFIVDRNGIVVSGSDPSRLLEPIEYDVIRKAVIKREKGVARFNSKQGVKVAVYVPVLQEANNDLLGWSLVIVQSQNDAYAPVYRTRYGLLLAAMTCFLVVSILSPWLSRQVSSRVNKLVRVTHRLGLGDLSEEVEDLGEDEIGELGKAFNRASQQLAESQQKIIEYSEHLEELVNERTTELKATQAQLVETARVAGMAEVSTGVLHNIGNAINSVNVRLKPIREMIEKLDVTNLVKTTDMLETNFGQLDDYLARDTRGQKVLPYMKIALNNMAAQRNQIISDIQFLDGQITHICEIVTLQQSYAKGRHGLREEFSIDEILSDSIRMQSDILEGNGIVVETDFSYSTPMLLDRNQSIQVFVNLIKNAAQSIVEQAPDEKVIRISTQLSHNSGGKSSMLHVVIKDTGVGFSHNFKDKIFNYGFSTKKEEGKGFGLHTCANYLQSIGGSIEAESSGPGMGAQFIVKIPIESPKTRRREV